MTAATVDLTDLSSRLVALLEAEGVEEPLAQDFPLCCILADLCALAGADVPQPIADYIDDAGAVVAHRSA